MRLATHFKRKFSQCHYRTSIYFWIPDHLEISPRNFPEAKLLELWKSKVRLDRPGPGTGESIDITDAIQPLKESLLRMQRGTSQHSIEAMLCEAKMFGCMFAELVLSSAHKLRKSHSLICDADDYHLSVTVAYSKHIELLKSFRTTLENHLYTNSYLLERVKDHLQWIDEYISNSFIEGIGILLSSLQNYSKKKEYQKTIDFLSDRLKKETTFRSQQSFINFHGEDDNERVGHMLQRESVLKRFVWSALFLEMAVPPLFILQKNLGPMIAAAIAATWATAVQFLILQNSIAGQNLSFAFKALAGITAISILAYVVKDRLKDIIRQKLQHGIFGKLPTFKQELFYRNAHGRRRKVGTLEEDARYVNGGKMPIMVSESFRAIVDPGSMLGQVQILKYSRTLSIKLKTKMLNSDYVPKGLFEMLRLHINDLVKFIPKGIEATTRFNPDTMEALEVSIPHTHFIYLVTVIEDLSQPTSSPKILAGSLKVDSRGIVEVSGFTTGNEVNKTDRPSLLPKKSDLKVA